MSQQLSIVTIYQSTEAPHFYIYTLLGLSHGSMSSSIACKVSPRKEKEYGMMGRHTLTISPQPTSIGGFTVIMVESLI